MKEKKIKDDHPLKKQRRLLGISLTEAASRANISKGTALSIEKGSLKVELGNYMKYAGVVGFDIGLVIPKR